MLRQKDFRTQELVGATHATANTQKQFRHGAEQLPWAWIVLEGDVYVPRHGAGPNTLDVRSSNSAEEFRILLFFN